MPPKSTPPKAVAKSATPRAAKSAAPTPPTPVAEPPAVESAAPTPAAKAAPTRSRAARAAEQRAAQARRASVMLKFVSDPTRLQVILFLAHAEYHVGALCDQLGQTQPAVSHHLALLRHGGIISPRRLGKNNFYSLSPAGTELAKVVQSLLQSA